jgi:purine nucleosidase
MRIHLDTDLGSDTDDFCALAMLLGWPGVELTGVTTSSDPGGQRAGFVHYALRRAGRPDVRVAPGAEGSLGGFALSPITIPDYWPEPILPRPAPPGVALELLAASCEIGATVVAVGPYTNLAMLETSRPGLLASTRVVVMGGHVPPVPPGLPPWGVLDDFNVQQDAVAAKVVFEQCEPVVVPLAVSLQVALRRSHLEPLREAGPLAHLLADQGEMHARDHGRTELGRRHEGLPDDLLNFQYDPLACAVAAGWDGVTMEDIPCALEMRDGLLHMEQREDAPPLRVVTEVDGERFEETWLDAVVRASSGA